VKAEIRKAIDRIEHATEHLADVPLASSAPAPSADSLPRISQPEMNERADRPIPSRE
jgi:hypothetical protein